MLHRYCGTPRHNHDTWLWQVTTCTYVMHGVIILRAQQSCWHIVGVEVLATMDSPVYIRVCPLWRCMSHLVLAQWSLTLTPLVVSSVPCAHVLHVAVFALPLSATGARCCMLFLWYRHTNLGCMLAIIKDQARSTKTCVRVMLHATLHITWYLQFVPSACRLHVTMLVLSLSVTKGRCLHAVLASSTC